MEFYYGRVPCFFSHGRYGKKEGFRNHVLKQVHDVGTRFQQRNDLSIHENVLEYEEAGPALGLPSKA